MSEGKGARRQAGWRPSARGRSTSTAWPKHSYLVWMGLVWLLLPVSAFAGVAEQLTEAGGLVQGRQYDQAEKLYKAVLEQATDQDQQLAAQKGLALLYVAANKTSQAEAAYQQMLERFAGNAGLPQAVYEVGRGHKDVKPPQGAPDKALQIYQSVIRRWKDTEWAVHSQRNIIHSHLERSDDKAANAAVDTLLADFAQHKDIAGTIYNLGKHYRNVRKPEIALKLHQYNVEHYANALQGMYSQVEIIKSAISKADDAAADQEFGRLVQVFSDQATLPKEAYQVGIAYSKANKPEQARQYYQYVVDHWPDSDAAVRAQLAILDKESPPGANTTVEEAFNRLIAAFSQNKTPAKEVYHTAMRYRQTRPVQARQVHQYNAEQSSKDDQYAMWSQTELAKSWILEGNEKEAEAAGNRLMTVFAGQPTLPTELCRLGDAYLVAGKPDKAEQIYKHVLDHTAKGDGQLIWARAGMARLLAAREDDPGVQKAIDVLITDFRDDPDLGEAVFGVGDEYYNQAMAKKQRGGADDAVNASLRKTLVVWDRIITGLPESAYAADAWYFSGVLYRKYLGDYEKAVQYYQNVVDQWPDYRYAWSAQGMIGPCYARLRDLGKVPMLEAEARIEQAYEALAGGYPDCSLAQGALLRLGHIQAQKGQWEQAAASYQRFLERYPEARQWRPILLHLAGTYQRMGQMTAAAELFRTYLAVADPMDEQAKAVQTRLDLLTRKGAGH